MQREVSPRQVEAAREALNGPSPSATWAQLPRKIRKRLITGRWSLIVEHLPELGGRVIVGIERIHNPRRKGSKLMLKVPVPLGPGN